MYTLRQSGFHCGIIDSSRDYPYKIPIRSPGKKKLDIVARVNHFSGFNRHRIRIALAISSNRAGSDELV